MAKAWCLWVCWSGIFLCLVVYLSNCLFQIIYFVYARNLTLHDFNFCPKKPEKWLFLTDILIFSENKRSNGCFFLFLTGIIPFRRYFKQMIDFLSSIFDWADVENFSALSLWWSQFETRNDYFWSRIVFNTVNMMISGVIRTYWEFLLWNFNFILLRFSSVVDLYIPHLLVWRGIHRPSRIFQEWWVCQSGLTRTLQCQSSGWRCCSWSAATPASPQLSECHGRSVFCLKTAIMQTNACMFLSSFVSIFYI